MDSRGRCPCSWRGSGGLLAVGRLPLARAARVPTAAWGWPWDTTRGATAQSVLAEPHRAA